VCRTSIYDGAYCHYASVTSKLQKHFSKISMKENEIIDLSKIVNTCLDENGVQKHEIPTLIKTNPE